ncbi:MAG: hypothetical protein LBJ87_07980 [bacterium]|jgi:hypothetical protein|nr:hypothetical protein [bacterium]
MTASLKDLFPQKDLLDTVGDVETQLRARRRVGVVGWFALAYTGVQAAVVVANTSSLGPVGAGAGSALQRYWPVLLTLVLFVVAAALVVWYYFSLRASRHAFRFTYSVDGFEPIPNTAPAADERLAYLAADLSERLARNITRLRLRDPDASEDASGSQESHVRIRGNYAVREAQWSEDDDGAGGPARVLRITVWIRVGTQGSAESLAHPVSVDVQPGDPGGQDGATPASSLGPAQYEALLNRVYFHVASEVYERVRADVRRRIRLLPTARLRVLACMAEAEDYASSPTFDAYSDAAEFFEEAIFAYGGRPAPRPPVQRVLHEARLLPHALWSRCRGVLARNVWSGTARAELLTARAEVGYATMTINRQMLAMLSGKRNVLVGLARAYAERAERRLEPLPLTDEVRNTRFDAKTVLAIAWLRLEDPARARELLQQARALAPLRADTDPRYLLAQALQEPDPRIARERFRHAVEANPADDEIAQYLLAEASERVWRSQLVDGPDPETAALVCREYQRVLQINPGNLSASTAVGYIRWLLGEDKDLAAAEQAFRYGLEYKVVQRDTYVAELDYALARTLAEQGRFAEAYSHFTSAESAIEASGMAYGQAGFAPTSWQGPPDALDPMIQRPWIRSSTFHDYIAPLMRDRYTRYRDTVARFHDRASAGEGEISRRLRDVVYGWVLTDYAEACEAYYRRSGDTAWHERAVDTLGRALEVDPWQVMARYDRYSLEWADPEDMRRLETLAPQWLRPRLDSLREAAPTQLRQELAVLLPHYWLRTGKNGDIDPLVLLQSDSGSEHRWEAEFEDAHVEALKRWGIRYPDGLSSRPPGLAEAEIDRVRTAVLELIRRHFRTDFEVLTWLSPPDAARSLRRWWAQDPVSWERLQWTWLPLRGESAPETAGTATREALGVLLAAAESPSWSSPIVTRWLADRLDELATARELDADARRRAEAARARCLAQVASPTP